MMAQPEQTAARDAAIDQILPHVARHGWSRAALRSAGCEAGDVLFAGGPADLVEAYIDLMDRRMVAAAAALPAEPRLTRRVRALIQCRLELARDNKPAVRRAVSMLAQPQHAALAARCLARTVDVIWHAAGDTSADFSWYTKRAILAGVYSSTLLFWMNQSTDEAAALGFLDRRLAAIGRISKFRSRIESLLRREAA
jgi:ubiquinone biosynthesis protein COQ9